MFGPRIMQLRFGFVTVQLTHPALNRLPRDFLNVL